MKDILETSGKFLYGLLKAVVNLLTYQDNIVIL